MTIRELTNERLIRALIATAVAAGRDSPEATLFRQELLRRLGEAERAAAGRPARERQKGIKK